MQLNKKSFALYLIVFISTQLSVAQTDQGNESFKPSQNISDKQLKKWTTKLSLTEGQTKQIAAINESYNQKIKSAQAATWEKSNVETTLMNLRKEKKETIKSLLNNDQLSIFQVLENKEKEHNKELIGKPRKSKPIEGSDIASALDEKRLQKMKKKLSLTEIQVNQIAAINADYAAVMKALKAAALGEDGPDKSAVKAVKALKETAISQVLTAEQLEIYEK